jgi:hypothetical protein
MASLAVFIAWTMLRAFRTGQVFSRGSGYTTDDQPTMFALIMLSHALMIFFCLWLAAGYDLQGFLRLFGLEWVTTLRH